MCGEHDRFAFRSAHSLKSRYSGTVTNPLANPPPFSKQLLEHIDAQQDVLPPHQRADRHGQCEQAPTQPQRHRHDRRTHLRSGHNASQGLFSLGSCKDRGGSWNEDLMAARIGIVDDGTCQIACVEQAAGALPRVPAVAHLKELALNPQRLLARSFIHCWLVARWIPGHNAGIDCRALAR